MPNVLSKIFGKSLNNMKNKIRMTKPNVIVNMTGAYPSLLFEFNIDSKAEIAFKPIELTAYVYYQSAFMGKIYWNQNEKSKTEKEGLADLGIAPHYEFDEVQDVKAEGVAKVRLHFSPSLEVFKFEQPAKWHLEVFMRFSTILGDVSKRFSHDFTRAIDYHHSRDER